MERLRSHLPSAALLVALLALAVGLSPAADAARDVVARALFARNADRVDGIHADRKPTPRKLLPLRRDGKFPASVLPAGLQGPKRDKGDKGDTATRAIPARRERRGRPDG